MTYTYAHEKNSEIVQYNYGFGITIIVRNFFGKAVTVKVMENGQIKFNQMFFDNINDMSISEVGNMLIDFYYPIS